nr:replication factor A protein 1-like [Ipomoea batatas]
MKCSQGFGDKGTNWHNAFPVVRINTDQNLVSQYFSELLCSQAKDLTSQLHLIVGEDEFDEGFLSDEADSPVVALGYAKAHQHMMTLMWL